MASSFMTVMTSYCNPLVTHAICCTVFLVIAVPTPNVTVTAPNTQTVGQSLTLECSVTTVRGITSRVDIIWSRNDEVLNRTNDTSATIMDSLQVYTDTYTISPLSTYDEDRDYKCQVMINSRKVVTAADNVTLNVTGKQT